MGQRTFRIDFAPSVVGELLRMSCSAEQKLRTALQEIAEAASGLPPIGHPAWRRWRGIGEECFSITGAGWCCAYAIEPSMRRIVVFELIRDFELPHLMDLPDRPLYAS